MILLNTNPPLVFWIDATIGVTTSSGAITNIQDSSGFNNLTTATAPNRPPLTPGIFNSGIKPGINFESAGADQLNFPKIILNNGYSAFVTFDCSTVSSGAASTRDVPFVIVGDTSSTAQAEFGLDGNNVAYTYNQIEVVGTGGAAANGNNHTIAVSHNINGNVRLFYDGALNKTATTAVYSLVDTAVNALCVGFLAGDNFNNGNIAEVFIWNGAIDDSLVAALHIRAKNLWF